jgi:hypothetical protein
LESKLLRRAVKFYVMMPTEVWSHRSSRPPSIMRAIFFQAREIHSWKPGRCKMAS